eukprot:CAMPEP_0175084030 /NCGR_PEP_ID=MMETSP0052_2-20121109/27782_1 /TAXON_ID=51329 ORGANISM="Polytomella parva, Strain SAG 63-3" /NCGR_SAMPLE_ID=MMETSP0052_2 /ASSEMBLY_ACC=CAM_ASM_000194 /LENGTH=203 /DNA_ID=CAMNT_0016355687 /DNA_START=142 /DNA_END=754 /DNA_ORIENTATION=-
MTAELLMLPKPIALGSPLMSRVLALLFRPTAKDGKMPLGDSLAALRPELSLDGDTTRSVWKKAPSDSTHDVTCDIADCCAAAAADVNVDADVDVDVAVVETATNGTNGRLLYHGDPWSPLSLAMACYDYSCSIPYHRLPRPLRLLRQWCRVCPHHSNRPFECSRGLGYYLEAVCLAKVPPPRCFWTLIYLLVPAFRDGSFEQE